MKACVTAILSAVVLSASLAVAHADVSKSTGGKHQMAPAAPAQTSKRKIDKTCLMMCDKWTDKGCEKWVMRCKGDPGYPKGLLLSQ
ncbi:hypothetical protein FQ775_21935 [Nitratireductor mangrovi]|uniref:Uncharacterized protein n=1 Tax=Nitratireductor mangrovi TaxID=2599600 RepID=A0A5B8L4M3_9HYPH|nr:hypothetical protein [Nitratireductor mangrovi]QDZ02814.1 hypothetical protein FQ775_21935 [Nitratireductor mangrovi]